jgi:NTE family protein
MRTNKIGLVLSGGGYRGAAHAGAIKALEEFDIRADCISGTSAGALAGALYAANYSPEEILGVFKKVKIFGVARYARNKPGWVDTDKFREFLLQYFPDDSFDKLDKTLYVTSTDLLNGHVKVFNSGELIAPLLASASFPGIFSPVEIGDGLYADGGILDNFPVSPVKEAKQIYGVYANPVMKMEMNDFKHSYDVVNRAFQLRMHKSSLLKFSSCDMVINPQELSRFRLFNSNHVEELFEIGYKHTYEALMKKKAEIHYLEK